MNSSIGWAYQNDIRNIMHRMINRFQLRSAPRTIENREPQTEESKTSAEMIKGLTLTSSVKSKQSVARVSIIASGTLVILKLLVGLLSGSLGLLAEAAHSLLDLAATVITFLVVRVAAIPPDENHPYGHERAENLGSLAGMALLAGTGIFILYHAFQKIFFHPGPPQVTVWSFAVLIVSVIVDYLRARTLKQASKQLDSNALASDAEHFANDMLGSIAVIMGLGIVALGKITPIPEWLVGRADAIAALAVAIVAFRSVWSLSSEAVHSLMDDVPADLIARLKKRVESVEGVVPGTVMVRTRFVGSRPYVEVKLGTQRGTSLESAHQLSKIVEKELSLELGTAEAIVHVEPIATAHESRAESVRAIADRLGLRVHNLNIYLVARETRIELDLELPDTLTLEEAHQKSELLETAIAKEIPGTVKIDVHLEARSDEPRPAVRHAPSNERVKEALAKLPEAGHFRVHDVLVMDEGLVVTLEKSFPGRTPLSETHDKMAELERALRNALPEVVRVHINPEIERG
jgi:cation diffusion facilitator family transporter